MKRWPWYIAALILTAVLGWMPFEGSDVAKLEPVEVVWVQQVADSVRVKTDTDNMGTGKNLSAAFQNLKDSTPGRVFLETADYVLINQEAASILPELAQYLRPASGVCILESNAELDEIAQFLNAHSPKVSLLDCQKGNIQLQRLIVQEGRMQLEP